jgi:Phosphotransferase enzyme family
MSIPGPAIPLAELHAVFGTAVTDTSDVTAESIHEPTVSATLGIWRVRAADRTAILKLVAHSEGGHPNWRSGEAASHWLYWRREPLAFESGLLDFEPGSLRAPACALVAERDDGSVALWLEDVQGLPGAAWPVDRYGSAARHLGRMHGTFLADGALPELEWLSRDWLRIYLEQRDTDLELVDREDLWRHPLIARHFADPPIDRLIAMRRNQDTFLAALDRLPRTLCHLDVHPDNLFADGDDATVAIDWAFVGIGAIGEDAGNLVPDSVLDFHISPSRIRDLDATVTAGYIAGLADRGWRGSASSVRLGMVAAIAAKYAWIAPAMLRAVAEDRELLNRRPITAAIAAWAPTIDYLLDCADEASELAVLGDAAGID